MKSLAFATILIGGAIAALMVLPILFVFAMSFDDASNNTDVGTWFFRIILLSLPVVVAGIDFIAWRAYQRGNYDMTLKIGAGFVVLLLLFLFFAYSDV